MTDLIINFDDPRQRANLVRTIGLLKGLHKIEIKRYRAGRSNQANRFLWGPVYGAFVQWRQEQGEECTTEQAHFFFTAKFLRSTVVNTDTGEIVGSTVASTAKLNTEEFSIYLDKVLAWLADYGIEVPSPETYAMT